MIKSSKYNNTNLIEKNVNIYDFSEEGFQLWYQALSKEAKKAIGNTPIFIPPDFIIKTIKVNPMIGLETIFIPDYKDLVKYGRAVRLRLVSLAIRDKYACSRLTYLINTLKSYKENDKEMFNKVTLIAEDMKEASKAILGKRIVRSIYRKNTIKMITSTMETIIKVKLSPQKTNQAINTITQEKNTPNQNSKMPSVD